ncbi:membrane-spanning 4-domains, subfamily A, member 17A.17 isoform X3 [Syngnathoides biaculeatus]|uniref:membrane-spanning 4-domains, subfamily A, member 17A.17 isoform X3 n=1 Tax=Syngnathoides biaculeatus TaxID=300417 RepID=UPI002ADD68FB|nr:membrane-spanning 4-domains, subfamily A, member 17A.17 isoform X3 [Syngnathoides biaculeatus]
MRRGIPVRVGAFSQLSVHSPATSDFAWPDVHDDVRRTAGKTSRLDRTEVAWEGTKMSSVNSRREASEGRTTSLGRISRTSTSGWMPSTGAREAAVAVAAAAPNQRSASCCCCWPCRAVKGAAIAGKSLTMTANILCAVLSVVAVVLYALDLGGLSVDLFCADGGGWRDNGCRDAASYAVRLTRATDVTLLVLAVLVLCVSVLAAIAVAGAAQRDEEVEEFHPGKKVLLLDLHLGLDQDRCASNQRIQINNLSY